jgi:O-antigen ligase
MSQPLADVTVQTVASTGAFDRARFARAAEWLAIAVAVSLPWSTSASGILIALWLLAVIPTLDRKMLRGSIAFPAAAFPVALFVLGVIGLTWSIASFEDQLNSIKQFPRLLAIPLLFIQFRNSDRGMWVVGGFLVSSTILLAVSWFLAIWPALAPRPGGYPGVPVKDYIIQSGEFLICAFALTHLAISAWRDGRGLAALALAIWAMIFLLNIVFVATARSTLIVFAALLVVLAVQRFDWKGILVTLGAGVVLAGLAWTSSPYLRARVLAVPQEIHDYLTADARTSSGYRLEFWKKSIQFIEAAPVLGHGTGSIKELFRRVASGQGGASAEVTNQPHNQTFLIAIQVGLVGAALLFGIWISHLLLFRGGGLAAWLGCGLVVHNLVMCLFNSYLFEFTLGWVYVFGVGVLGGMVLRQRAHAGADGAVAVGSKDR